MDTPEAVTTQAWLTRSEVMDHLRIGSHHTLRKLIADGLPVHWLLSEMRFDREEVDLWLRSRCIDPAAGERRRPVPRQALVDYSEYLHRGGRQDLGTWWQRYKDNYPIQADTGDAA